MNLIVVIIYCSVDYEILHATDTLPESNGFWKKLNIFKKQQEDVFEERYLRFISVLGKVQQKQNKTQIICRPIEDTVVHLITLQPAATKPLCLYFFKGLGWLLDLKYDTLC